MHCVQMEWICLIVCASNIPQRLYKRCSGAKNIIEHKAIRWELTQQKVSVKSISEEQPLHEAQRSAVGCVG